MKIFIYVILVLSIFAPIYTYILYPLILRLCKKKKYVIRDIEFSVDIIICNFEIVDVSQKIDNLKSLNYGRTKICIYVANSIKDINRFILNSISDYVLFTDNKTELERDSLKYLVRRFADKRIGCVVGQQRKKVSNITKKSNNILWKYENDIKILESNLGKLSGANNSIFLVKKELIPIIDEKVINLSFYISTYILQLKYDVVMESHSIAYENKEYDEKQQFKNHIIEGAGAYQALGIFWRLLFPRKGTFTYISHRVIKWLLPFNLILIFICPILLLSFSTKWIIIILLQVLFYVFLIIYSFFSERKKERKYGLLSNLIYMTYYFFKLQLSYFIGFLRKKQIENE